MSINHFGFETILIDRKVLFVHFRYSYYSHFFRVCWLHLCVPWVNSCLSLIIAWVSDSFFHLDRWSIFLLRLELIIIKCLAHNTKRQLSNIFIQVFCHSNYVYVIRLLRWLSHSHQSFRNEIGKRKNEPMKCSVSVIIIIKRIKTELHITHGNLRHFVHNSFFVQFLNGNATNRKWIDKMINWWKVKNDEGITAMLQNCKQNETKVVNIVPIEQIKNYFYSLFIVHN